MWLAASAYTIACPHESMSVGISGPPNSRCSCVDVECGRSVVESAARSKEARAGYISIPARVHVVIP